MSKMRLGTGRVLLYSPSGIAYLLRDEFTTARAAGAVNGTAAEPGPGTRVVTDTASHLTIAGGALTCDGGEASDYGDPGLWLDSVTRVAGRTMVCHFRPANATSYMRIGWDQNQTTGGQGLFFTFVDGGSIIAYDVSGNSAGLGVYTGATDYYLAIRLLATTANFYIKGGAWATWTLLYNGVTVDTTTPLYPSFLSYNMAYTSKFACVPDVLWDGADVAVLDRIVAALG